MSSQDDDGGRRYDVVVIGAGPAGEAAAELGGNLGYRVALVERDTVGGTVVTSGGAPTKTFREAAAYLSGFEKEKVYGVALSAPPEVMYPAVAARARRVSEQLGRPRWSGSASAACSWSAARHGWTASIRSWPAPPMARRRGCAPDVSSSRPGPARCARQRALRWPVRV